MKKYQELYLQRSANGTSYNPYVLTHPLHILGNHLELSHMILLLLHLLSVRMLLELLESSVLVIVILLGACLV